MRPGQFTATCNGQDTEWSYRLSGITSGSKATSAYASTISQGQASRNQQLNTLDPHAAPLSQGQQDATNPSTTEEAIGQVKPDQNFPDGATAHKLDHRAVSQPTTSIEQSTGSSRPPVRTTPKHQGKKMFLGPLRPTERSSEYSKTESVHVSTDAGPQNLNSHRFTISSPRDQAQLQNMTKEWGFCPDEVDKRSFSLSGGTTTTFRSKFASTTRAKP